MKRVNKIAIQEERRPASAAGHLVLIQPLVVVLAAGERMLPSRWRIDGDLRAGKEIVLPRELVRVRREKRLSIEVPKALYASARVRVPGAQPQANTLRQLHSDVAALLG